MRTSKKTHRRKPVRRTRRLPQLLPDWVFSRRGDTVILESRALSRFPWLVHGFSTRLGGASERDGRRMLNLGFVEWDEPKRVEKNRREFFAALGAREMEPVALRQFHSSMVRVLRRGAAEFRQRRPCRGDALLTGLRGRLLTMQTADCVPILLVDSRQRIAGAIHAGWRGTARRIAEKAVGDMRMNFGTRPEDLWAAIGPAIGLCCYDVGPDVAQEFGCQFAGASEWFEGPFEPLSIGDEPTPFLWLQTDPPGHDRPKRVQLDLAAANRRQLENAGVNPERISSCGMCTSCQNDWFFSYRREGPWAGRLMAAIGIRVSASGK